MARATVGICVGVCVAISAAAVASQGFGWLAAHEGWHADIAERWVRFATWLGCILWSARRPPSRAARELLWLAAVVTLMIPLVHGLTTGAWFWRSIAAGHGSLAAIDLGALALALGLAWLARVTARRGLHGNPHSVWAEPMAAD
jgi:hypothetical protein